MHDANRAPTERLLPLPEVTAPSTIDALMSERVGDSRAGPIAKQPPAVSWHPSDVDCKRRFLLQLNQQNLGFLGRLFGSRSAAATNIAGLVAMGSMGLLAVSFLVTPTAEIVDARKWLFALTTSALSFIFGAASKN